VRNQGRGTCQLEVGQAVLPDSRANLYGEPACPSVCEAFTSRRFSPASPYIRTARQWFLLQVSLHCLRLTQTPLLLLSCAAVVQAEASAAGREMQRRYYTPLAYALTKLVRWINPGGLGGVE